MGIEQWSTSAGSNNQSPPNGWPSGMLPSQVEPTARQMMASVAAWYQAAQWINYNLAITYISGTQFSVAGNQTSLYQVGRRVQATDGSTSVYGTITASTFSTLTTITVSWDSGVLQTGVTIVYLGIISASNTSLPPLTSTAFANPTGHVGLTAVNGTAVTAMRSDAAPPIDVGISPTWTGSHTFSDPVTVNGAGSSLKGGVTIVAPASGVALTANAIGGSFGVQVVGPNGNVGAIGLQDGQTGNRNWYVGAGFSGVGAFDIRDSTRAATVFTINSTGNVTFSAPSSGDTIALNGVANGNAMTLQSSSTAGQGFGAFWRAGTNSSDYSLLIRPATGSTNYFQVRGDGIVQAVDQGGSLQDVGWRDVPQNSQIASYQLVLADRGKGVDFNGTSLTCTIPANGTVAFPIGTTIVITNLNSSNLSIAITTDTLTLAGTTTTGTRTLAQNGMASIRKVTSTSWLISGSGLS